MAKIHVLKLNIKYFEDVKKEIKKFELRKNDRDYKIGDLIKFEIVNDQGEKVESLKDCFLITYILKDIPQYGLNQEYAILQIEKYKQK